MTRNDDNAAADHLAANDIAANHLAAIDRVVDFLRHSRSLLFITGAGISADSGLPTYRGIGGLYNAQTTEDGLAIEDALSGAMMRSRPEVTWKYLGQIEKAARGATFNRAHQVIAEMESHFERVWTLTQNVDGFHRLAGAKNVLEIHGNMRHLDCTSCELELTVDDYCDLQIPPFCRECGAMLRPRVVLFGEMLPEAVQSKLFEECEIGFDCVFSIGTTSVFPYIAAPVQWAQRAGRPTVEINPGESDVSRLVEVKLALGAAVALESIWRRYRQRVVV